MRLFDPEDLDVKTHRTTLLYVELRLLGRSAEQDGGAARNANRSSPIWNGNAFSYDRYTAGNYGGAAYTDHDAGCGTRHDADSSWDIHTPERSAANDTGTHNAGNHATKQHNDSEHAGCSGSLHDRSNPKLGTEWIDSDQQRLESDVSFFIVNDTAGLDESNFDFQFYRSYFTEFNRDSDSVSTGNGAHSCRMPSGNGAECAAPVK